MKMEHYYVNDKPQNTGEHEVHKEGCIFLPSDRTYLGYLFNCQEALIKARNIYSNVDGCKTCSNACHTR